MGERSLPGGEPGFDSLAGLESTSDRKRMEGREETGLAGQGSHGDGEYALEQDRGAGGTWRRRRRRVVG